MTLACQKNSYAKELTTKVVSCDLVNDFENSEEGNFEYVVALEDSVLFPEGGGQPHDIGTINNIPVIAVRRNGNETLHVIGSPLNVGDTAHVVVNWERRFDHMQQHTGQHLITAVAENLFKYVTTSWSLGENLSFIELDIPSMKLEQIAQLEKVLNEKIRECIPVNFHLYDRDAPELLEVRTRLELPEDHVGPVRVVEIEGIDRNTCCGTHVKNTSELQAIKLLYVEKGKKNKINLYFIVGNRVLKYLDDCVARERNLSTLLGSPPENLYVMVEKQQKSLKIANKNALIAVRELATCEAKLFKLLNPKPRFYSLHKKNTESDFISVFLNEVNDSSTLFFLTVGDGKAGGQLTLVGPEHIVQEYGPKVCEILEGKGNGKKGKYQAKFAKASNIHSAEKLLKNALNIEG